MDKLTLSEKDKVMKALNLKSTIIAMTFLAAITLVSSTFPSVLGPRRLDLFDAQGNNLMFVTFQYENGINTTDSVFFSDSTFTRKVFVKRDAQGLVSAEAAINFADDTVFNSAFTPSGANMNLQVKDQFKIDQFHGIVSYSKASDLEFNFFQSGAQINKVSYVYGADGWPKKVNIFDKDNNLAYYGLFDSSYTGVLSPQGKSFAPRPSLTLKGNNALAWEFTLDHASKVTCDAISLAGRRVATLFSGNLPIGVHSKTIPMGGIPSMTNGVYIAVMSIDNKPVARTKFIIQHARGGV
jgi:hypothetical protein